MPIGAERASRRDKVEKSEDTLFSGKARSFADVVAEPADAKKGVLDRTVRKEKPGRDVPGEAANRGGERTDESESNPDSGSAGKRATAHGDPKTKAKAKRDGKALPAESPLTASTAKAVTTSQMTSAQGASKLPAEAVDGGEESEDDFETRSAVTTSATDGNFAAAEMPKGKSPDGKQAAAQVSVKTEPGLAQAKAMPPSAAQVKSILKEGGEGKIKLLELMRTEQGEVRQESMQEFLNQMQVQFGVPPEKVVAAFSKLDDASLSAPPEESVQAFVKNLPLAPGDQDRAAQIYREMVATTGAASFNEKMIDVAEASPLAEVDEMPPQERALAKLSNALDEMNEAFGISTGAEVSTPVTQGAHQQLRAQLAAESMNSQLARLSQKSRAGESKPASENERMAAGLMALIGKGATDDEGLDANELGTGATAPKAGTGGANNAFAPISGGEQASAFNGSFGDDAQSGSGNSHGSALNNAESSNGGKTFASSMAAGAAREGSKRERADDGLNASKVDVTDPSPAAQQLRDPATKSSTGAVVQTLEQPVALSKDDEANTRELLRQAQVVLKKGGGEIKMDLKPEGVGQVHLKVSVDNGQVNVQVLTENDATKRLLEKGLHELKSNLASHELKLDTLKVDVGHNMDKQGDLDKRGDDQARQSTRQFAEDVMSQFRDERQSFQQGFMENPGWRQYGRPNKRASQGPEGSAAVAAADVRSVAKRMGNSSRLNLVA